MHRNESEVELLQRGRGRGEGRGWRGQWLVKSKFYTVQMWRWPKTPGTVSKEQLRSVRKKQNLKKVVFISREAACRPKQTINLQVLKSVLKNVSNKILNVFQLLELLVNMEAAMSVFSYRDLTKGQKCLLLDREHKESHLRKDNIHLRMN